MSHKRRRVEDDSLYLEDLEERYAKLTQEHAVVSERVKELEVDILNAEERAEEAEGDLEDQRDNEKEIDRLQERIEDVRSERNDEVADLQNSINCLTSDKVYLKQQVKLGLGASARLYLPLFMIQDLANIVLEYLLPPVITYEEKQTGIRFTDRIVVHIALGWSLISNIGIIPEVCRVSGLGKLDQAYMCINWAYERVTVYLNENYKIQFWPLSTFVSNHEKCIIYDFDPIYIRVSAIPVIASD
jgi:hypothetical protein